MFPHSFHSGHQVSSRKKKKKGQSTELDISIWETNSNCHTLIRKSRKLHSPTFQSSIKRKKKKKEHLKNSWFGFFLPLCKALTELQLAISPSCLRQLSNFKENWVSGVHFTSALRKGGSAPWTKNKPNSIKIRAWKCFQWETVDLWANDFPSWKISNNSGNKTETPEMRYHVLETCSKQVLLFPESWVVF